MGNSVEIIMRDGTYALEKEINWRIKGKNVKDIKFCVSEILGGVNYYAMIIYE